MKPGPSESFLPYNPPLGKHFDYVGSCIPPSREATVLQLCSCKLIGKIYKAVPGMRRIVLSECRIDKSSKKLFFPCSIF